MYGLTEEEAAALESEDQDFSGCDHQLMEFEATADICEGEEIGELHFGYE